MRLPAEWEPQRSVWLIWPGNPLTWPRHREQVKQDHAHLVATCSRYQPVDLICTHAWRAECEHYLKAARADLHQITFHDWPVNDAWIRDTGPLLLKTESGMEAVDLPFNAWGGKFPDWEDDDRITRRISEVRNVPCRRFPRVGEGGGLESNGQGILIVTESVWLNPNRNPGVCREEMDDAFKALLGVEEIVWLKAGMMSDDTDGHVDTLARFVSPTTVAVPLPEREHPDRDQLMQNRARLSERLTVIDLPHPHLGDDPVTYLNMVFLNGAVLVPVYGHPDDERALGLYRSLFPERDVIGVQSATFLREGGTLHCLTLNEWA